MLDKELVYEILDQILTASKRIARRSEDVSEPDDFILSDAGIDKLDAICMMLIAIGESLKNLDRITSGALLPISPRCHGASRFILFFQAFHGRSFNRGGR